MIAAEAQLQESVRPGGRGSLARRLLASLCAVLVLALTVFAASPAAHGLLHEDDHGHAHPVADDTCAVTMFASGVALPLGAITFSLPSISVQEVAPAKAAELLLVASRYLRQPERGPPVSLVS